MTRKTDRYSSRPKRTSRVQNPHEAAGKVIRIMTTAMGLAILITMVVAVKPPEPQEARAKIQASKPSPKMHSRMPNPTERELQKICTAQKDQSSNRAKPAAAWNGGWEGTLGEVASAAGLRFDWRCVVKGHSISEGFLCATRKEAAPTFQILPLHMAGLPLLDEEFPIDSEIQLQRIRKGLVEGDGVVVSVEDQCRVQIIIDSKQFMKALHPKASNTAGHEWTTPLPEPPNQALAAEQGPTL